jgi:DNA-binding GntR family transcriptional regulator
MQGEPLMPDRNSQSVVTLRRDDLDKVIAHLEDDIIFGRLEPGLRLTEDMLMARYDASRHFVRQSLVEMERRGIVRREKNIGATVRSYSQAEVRQIYEVREMLTRQAALMVALPASQALIDELRRLQDVYRLRAEEGDLRGIHDANDAFHIALFAACGNPYLVGTLQDYMNLTLTMRAKNLADSNGLRLSISQHELMIALLQARDVWAFAQLCVDHMQTSKADYLRRVAAGQDHHSEPMGHRDNG